MRDSRLFSLTFIIVGLALWTLAPYGGCSCNNPMGANSGPPATPTPDHGPLVDNMEHVASLTDNFNSVIATTADNLAASSEPVAPPPSTQSHNSTMNAANTVITAGGSTLPGGTAGYAACVSGYIGHDNPPYPFAQLIFNLSTPANVPFYAPGRQLKFSFKADPISVGQQFFVNFTDSVITDFGWYRYQFAPASTAWTSYTISFPGGTPPKFAQASFGACKAWDASNGCSPPQFTYVVNNINAVVFQPVPSVSTRLPYSFCVDDVKFQ